MDRFLEFLAFVSGSTVIIGVVAWLIKALATQLLSRDIENFKIALKADADRSVESLKHSLRMTAFEHEVMFSRLHEERASVIRELYEKLVKATDACTLLAHPLRFSGEPTEEERLKTADSANVDLIRYFDLNRIYLSEPLCEQVQSIVAKIREIIYERQAYVHTEPLLPDERREHIDAWKNAWNEVKGNVMPARRALEKEFRTLLGVKDS